MITRSAGRGEVEKDRTARLGEKQTPIKFGLRIPSFASGRRNASLDEMGRYLRYAEDLGFESALTIDHLLLTRPAYACTWLEPIATLAALAGVTRRIKLGTMVLVLPLRNPVHFAKEWATLDLLCGGRTILGIGVGWHEKEFALMGVPRKERGRRMDEMIESVTALWERDHVTYRGKYYRFDDVTIDPKPIQRPRPPIWIGGGTQPSEKVYGQSVPSVAPVLRRIAKYADCWIPHSSAAPEMVQSDWQRIRSFAKERGRNPATIGCVYSNFVWVLKPGERPESAIPHFAGFSRMDLDYWQRYYLLGTAEEVAAHIYERIAALDGRVDHIILNPLDWSREQLELIAYEVLPRVTTPFRQGGDPEH
jgi:probable F420-dependent oxidoreductase